MTLTEILARIADHVREELNIATFVSVPNSAAELPLLGFLPGNTTFSRSFGGAVTHDVDCWLLMAANDLSEALAESFCWLDPERLKNVIESTPDVPTAQLIVKSVDAPLDAAIGSTPVIALRYALEVNL